MKIKFDVRGEEELLRRLTTLAEMPGLDLALDKAADASLAAARSELGGAGETGIADSLAIQTGPGSSRRIVSDHPRAWLVQNGTRRRPALRWLQKAARAGGSLFRTAIDGVISRALGRPSGGGN